MTNNKASVLSLFLVLAVIAAAVEGVALYRLQGRQALSATSEVPPATPGDKKEEPKDENFIELSDERATQAGVICAPAAAGKLTEYLTLTGEVKLNADKTAQITSPVAGRVREARVALGDHVDAGTLLVVLSSRDLSAARSALATAHAHAALAAKNLEREKRLWEQKISAEQDYLQAKQAVAEAQIDTRAAEQQLAALGIPKSEFDKSSDPGDLSLYEITSPLAASVVDKNIVVGANIEPGTPLLTVSDLTSLWIDLDVRPEDLAKVQVGQHVILSPDQQPSDRTGEIAYIGPVLGGEGRTARARIIADNTSATWRPGQFAYGLIALREADVPVLLPQAAIQTIGGAPMAFVKVDGGYHANVVKLGRRNGDQVEVLSGVDAGACVVTEGSFVLKAELGKAAAGHDAE